MSQPNWHDNCRKSVGLLFVEEFCPIKLKKSKIKPRFDGRWLLVLLSLLVMWFMKSKYTLVVDFVCFISHYIVEPVSGGWVIWSDLKYIIIPTYNIFIFVWFCFISHYIVEPVSGGWGDLSEVRCEGQGGVVRKWAVLFNFL